jgi:hypothetical protein
MGKKTKEHKAKIAKRNRRIAQEKYSMQNALNKIMKQMAEQQEAEKLENEMSVSVGGQQLPFSVVDAGMEEVGSIVDFKEKNPDMFNITDVEVSSENE